MAVRKLKTKNQTKGTVGTKVSEEAVVALKELVDQGLFLTGVMKYVEKELKELKAQIMQGAKDTEQKKLVGDKGRGSVSVQQSSTTEIGAVDMVRHLRENKTLHLVEGLLKVRISDAKKILGEDALKNIMNVDTEPYGKLRFNLTGNADVEEIKAQIKKYL